MTAPARALPTPDDSATVIARVEAYPYRYTLGDGGYGCAKFIATERAGTLVKVVTRDGHVGWGEAIGDPDLVLPAVIHQARTIVGTSASVRASRIQSLISRKYHLTLGGSHMFAASALDTALWDAYARTLNVPISALLGGAARQRVRTYASTGYITPSDDAGRYRDELEAAVADGFEGAKVRIGTGPADDEQRVRTAREALGDARLLMVDYNTHGTLTSIRQSLPRLRQFDLAWIEEPLPPEDRLAWEQLRHSEDVLAGGESMCTRFAFRDAIDQRRFDVVQPDLAACGGITEGWAIAQQAGLYGVDVAPHCWGSGVLQLATLQLLAAVTPEPLSGRATDRAVFEWDRGENPFRAGVLQEPLRRKDGFAWIPQGPGLGAEVDEEWIRGRALEVVRIDI